MGHGEVIRKTGEILRELFNFDGQVEELCTMSEMEGQFSMTADDMIGTLKAFIAYATAEED